MSQQLCTFRVDGLLFGIDVASVQEVIRYQAMTPVPLAHPVVRGLINLRGQIVTAMDLRRRLGLAARPGDEQPMNVVIQTDDGPLSLLVDEIGDVVEVTDATFEVAPDTLDATTRDLILGAHKLTGDLLLLLDSERAAATEARAA